MKRWTLRILLCLLLGVVTTVAVAWGLAVIVDVHRAPCVTAYRSTPGIEDWRVHRFTAFGAVNYASRYEKHESIGAYPQTALVPSDLLPAWGTLEPTGENLVREVDGRGWPLIAMWCQIAAGFVPSHEGVSGAIDIGLAPRDAMYQYDFNPVPISYPRVLPLRPILPGFLINTLFYARKEKVSGRITGHVVRVL